MHAMLAAVVLAALTTTQASAQTPPPTRLVMAGSSSGGTAHLFFASLAPLLNKYATGIEASARTGGAVENVALLERGGVQVAVAGPGDAQAVLGKEGLDKSRIRTVFGMFHIPFHIIVPRTRRSSRSRISRASAYRSAFAPAAKPTCSFGCSSCTA
jgi:TRAP-type uncharacterized transport system substrate-binding protein